MGNVREVKVPWRPRGLHSYRLPPDLSHLSQNILPLSFWSPLVHITFDTISHAHALSLLVCTENPYRWASFQYGCWRGSAFGHVTLEYGNACYSHLRAVSWVRILLFSRRCIFLSVHWTMKSMLTHYLQSHPLSLSIRTLVWRSSIWWFWFASSFWTRDHSVYYCVTYLTSSHTLESSLSIESLIFTLAQYKLLSLSYFTALPVSLVGCAPLQTAILALIFDLYLAIGGTYQITTALSLVPYLRGPC